MAAGAAVGLAAGLAIGAAVGWIPLGPREPYRPWYHASRDYFGRVNRGNVTNITNITNVTNVNNFVNRGAGSYGTPSGVAGGPRPGGQWAGMTPQMLAAARPVTQVPVRPTLATPGVTPVVARQLSLAPVPPGNAAPPVAPGPAVLAHTAGAAAPLLLRAPGGSGMALRPAPPHRRPANRRGWQRCTQALPALATPGAGRPPPTTVPRRQRGLICPPPTRPGRRPATCRRVPSA